MVPGKPPTAREWREQILYELGGKLSEWHDARMYALNHGDDEGVSYTRGYIECLDSLLEFVGSV